MALIFKSNNPTSPTKWANHYSNQYAVGRFAVYYDRYTKEYYADYYRRPRLRSKLKRIAVGPASAYNTFKEAEEACNRYKETGSWYEC